MTNALESYQFDESPVRVLMIAGEPWFVANDVAAVLGYRDAPNMVRNLDDDEAATHIMSSSGQNREMNIISESGLYAAILKSRKPEARRFRKWVTSEVLPAIRVHGNYALPGHERYEEIASDFDATRMTAGVAVIREARRLFGPAAARRMWTKVGLPAPIADSRPNAHEELAEPIKEWMADKASATVEEAAFGIGIAPEDLDFATRKRIGGLLTMFGWWRRKDRSRGSPQRVWYRPTSAPSDEGDAS